MTPAADRIAEAARWLDAKLAGAPVPPLLLVIGLDEGYLLDLLETRSPETKVLAFEPDPEKANAFRARRDWSAWLESGRLRYLVDPDYAGSDEAWRIFPTGSDAHTLLVDPTIEGNVSPGAVRAARVMKDIIFGVRANAEARRKFAPRYLVNSLKNLPAVTLGSDVRALANAFKGLPAVVAGAGPSLDRTVAELRVYPGRALLIATDTALRPMLDAGLGPQLAVGLDPSTTNARHFRWLPQVQRTWLIGESALDQSAVDPFGDRTFWFRVSNHHPWPWYNELGIDVGTIDVWGSVLTAAFQVAVLAGCDPIVVVGADLSFTGARPYARGTTYEFDWTQAVAAGKTLEEVWNTQMARAEDRCEAPDLHGVPTMTTRTLMSFRDWLVSRAARSGRRVINATGAGIFFGDGVEQASLAEALSNDTRVPSLTTVPRIAPSTAAPASLSAAVAALSVSVTDNAATPPIPQWREFCSGGFDATAVAAALNGAAVALTRPQPASVDPGIEAMAGLVGLPEREATLRAAFTGRQIPHWARAGVIAAGSRTPVIDEAFSVAADALARALTMDSPPLDGAAGYFGEDVERTWGASVLDYRFHWTIRSWRPVLWDYHDALSIGLASMGHGPRAEAIDTLRPAIARLADEITTEGRACVQNDLASIHALVRESVFGYNLVTTSTGCIAAAQRLGPMVLPELAASRVDQLSRAGLLLWAETDVALVGRIERYVRHILLIAAVHGWTTVADPRIAGTAAKARLVAFTSLLERAAGYDIGSSTLSGIAAQAGGFAEWTR